MKCQKCNHENPKDMRFCVECGNKLEVTCPNCGFGNAPSFKFCGQCGQNLQATPKPTDYSEPQSYTPKFLADKILNNRSAIEGERKLVTVLFADVADYTALSEKLDPEEVHQIMDGCFKILMDEIHKYEGTINQFTGDGVMALFGAPVAHEDHAQRACHAAIAIQKALGNFGEKMKKDCGIDFRMRIGINSGPVIVGAIGDDLRMDYTAIGDTTNLAARMESAAEPGKILVSGNTYKITQEFFGFEPLRKIDLKGKSQAQDAFVLVKKGKVDSRIEASAARGLTRFVGRETAMATLMEAYDKVRSGNGQVVGIVGEAGVGKSRLVLEMQNRLPANEYTWLEGRCIHYGGEMAYLPILEILRSYFGIDEGDREFVVKKKLSEKICEIDTRLENKLSSFQALLSVKIDDPNYMQLDPAVRKHRTFEAIRDLLIRENENRPLVVVVEDLHWMDKTSENFLKYLIDSLPGTRIMLILLYRPEYIHQWGSKTYYSKIGLDQLNTVSSAELVKAVFEEGEAVPELRDLVLGKAGGNPLFVEEITHSLIENGYIQRLGKTWALTQKASDIQVPDTIQGIIAARLDRVEENLKRIMQVASVIGREFAFRILASITGMKEDLKSCLLNLQGLEFIYEKQLFPEMEYIFKHALTQEVAYGSLLVKRRKEIHEKIGSVIEQLYAERLEEYYEVLAYHYERSDNNGKALIYLTLANSKARDAIAMKDAKRYFYRAMEILDSMSDTPGTREKQIKLLNDQWIVFEQLYQFSEYHRLLTQYEHKLEQPHMLGLSSGFYAAMGVCELAFGDFDRSARSAEKALEIADMSGNDKYTSDAYLLLQYNYFCKGDFKKTHALKEDVLRTLEGRFHLIKYVMSIIADLMAFTYSGHWDEALENGFRALKAAREYADESQIAYTAHAIALAYAIKGELDKAMEYIELARKNALSPVYESGVQMVLAFIWCRAGDPQRAIPILKSYIEIFRAVPFRLFEMFCSCILAEGYLIAKEYENAEKTARKVLEISERCNGRLFTGRARLYLGQAYLETDVPSALPHIEACITIFKAIKAEDYLAKAYAACGQFYKKQGDAAQARKYLTKALDIFERLGTLIEPEKIKNELADLPVLEAEK